MAIQDSFCVPSSGKARLAVYTAMTIFFLIAYISVSESPNNIYLLGRLALIRLLHIVMGEPVKSNWTVTYAYCDTLLGGKLLV